MNALAQLVITGMWIASTGAVQTKSFSVVTVVQNHFAETTMKSEVLNDKNTTEQVKFHIMLPKEAFISGFRITIDGKTYEAVVQEKAAAKREFNRARERGQTAGLVETREKAEKIFSTDVNVGAYTTVTFELVYQQILRSLGSRYTEKIILFGDSLSELLTVAVYIQELSAIINLDVPPILLNDGGGSIDAGSTTHVDGNTARVSFAGTNALTNPALARGGGVFSVSYELEKRHTSADVIVDNGYVMYFGPDIPIRPKRLIFCLDDSGSMAGHKMQQVKEAMYNILDKLLPEDKIGVMKFSTSTRSWNDSLRNATQDNIRSAKSFVQGPDEEDSTEIWKALRRAIQIMSAEDDELNQDRNTEDSLIILLSDGQGSLSPEILLNNVNKMNRKRYTIHTISFGDGADDQMLKQIARDNHGRWKKILSDLDAALQIENYIDELKSGINSPLVDYIKYPEVVEEVVNVKNTGELLTIGRLRDDLSSYKEGPHEIIFDSDGALPQSTAITASFYLDQANDITGKMENKRIDRFVQKAFAMTKITKILDDIDLTTDPEEKALLKQKAINISLEFNLVTPVTSLLVIKPDDHKGSSNSTQQPVLDTPETEAPASMTQPSAPASAARPLWSFHGDPHFIARLTEDITVCFSWVGRPNEIVSLLYDYDNSIIINGLITGTGQDQTLTARLFVTKMAIILPEEDVRLQIDCDTISISSLNPSDPGTYSLNVSLRETDRRSYEFGILKIHISEIVEHHIIINLRIKKLLFVVEVQYNNGGPNSREHLDFIVPNYTSERVGGVFGHLQLTDDGDDKARIVTDENRNKTFLLYNGDEIEVRRSSMKFPYLSERVNCWRAEGHLQHLFGARLGSFKLNSLWDIPNKE